VELENVHQGLSGQIVIDIRDLKGLISIDDEGFGPSKGITSSINEFQVLNLGEHGRLNFEHFRSAPRGF